MKFRVHCPFSCLVVFTCNFEVGIGFWMPDCYPKQPEGTLKNWAFPGMFRSVWGEADLRTKFNGWSC